MRSARLVMPAIRADVDGGFSASESSIDDSIGRGVGGFIFFGGEAASVNELIRELRRRSPHPLLIASDLERGVGQQFAGATPLPPAAAIASLGDPEITRRAAELTAREATAVGVDMIFAPVADLDIEPLNPIIGTRAFGSDPAVVARHVAAWVRGCRDGGALSCGKHFPGHGRTRGDSHLERLEVSASRADLLADLAPFTAATQAGVDAMMTAHVAYPALDPAGRVATLSTEILTDLLRDSLGFAGIIVSDALGMAGLAEGIGEASAAVQALGAGCDLLLYPEQLDDVLTELGRALSDGQLPANRVAESVGRLDAALARMPTDRGEVWGTDESRRWADQIALRSLRVLRGEPQPPGEVELLEIDDDAADPHPAPSRTTFRQSLERLGSVAMAAGATPLVALYAEPRAWKGRAGLSASASARLRELCAATPEIRIVLFGHPRLAEEIPAARHVLCAWGGEPLMQTAAARWLSGRATGSV